MDQPKLADLGKPLASEEHLEILGQGVGVWNCWRDANPGIKPDLTEAELAGRDLGNGNFSAADLSNAKMPSADLHNADLTGANLSYAVLMDANVSNANLERADLIFTQLWEADLNSSSFVGAGLVNAELEGADIRDGVLREASLNGTDFTGALLDGVDFAEAKLGNNVFADVDLTNTKGLGSCEHQRASVVDHRTLQRSKGVPQNFWRGCGLPERLIEYLPSLLDDAIQYYSCFISFSSRDQEFADRLYADLQNEGVRCWFAPHDLPIGAKTWDGIDDAIRTRDKVLLILSKDAIASDWVEDEVTKAFAEERRRNELVLFPVRLDDTVMQTTEPWAGKLRDNRNIGDFARWKDHDAYRATFERVLRDLKPKPDLNSSMA